LTFIGDHYLLGYIIKFFWIDILLLLPLWIFIYGLLKRKSNKMQTPGPLHYSVENKKNLFSSLDRILGNVHPDFRIILLLISFAIAIMTVPFGVFAILPIFWPLLIAFPSYLTYSPLYQHLPSSLIRAIGHSDFSLFVGWILYSSLIVPIILTKRSIWIILYLLFIFLLINNVVGCQKSLDVSW